MRAHTSDRDEGTTRPSPARQASQDAAGTLRALASGRPHAISPAGLLHLQRVAGNAGVASLLAEEESPVKDVVGKGGGSPLDADLRADMEGRFGADFGDVRIHTDAKAADSAKAVGAHAYTAGADVVFQRDHYAPGTDAGKRTLAHELTHVLQQRAGPVAGTPAPGGINLSHPSDPFEQAATTTAARVMSTPAGAVQREQIPEEEPTAEDNA
ncbi:MAG: DUF4157 domain-containing protein [Egibacteraceae bacterium]